MRGLIIFAAAAALILSAIHGYAHDEFRIIGTVTARQPTGIAVKNKDGKTTLIAIDKQTLISRDKKKVDAAELKTGRYVVVDAIGDTEKDLLALEVRLVSAPAK